METGDFARTPAFVVFWTNILDWTGSGGAESFSAGSVTVPDQDWTPTTGRAGEPGIYSRADGVLRAVNVAPVTIDPPVTSNWQAKLAKLKPRDQGGLQLAPWLELAALTCVLAALVAWPRRRGLTAFSAPRTV
jgi:hypothetical protein